MQTKLIAIRYKEVLYLHRHKTPDGTFEYTWCDSTGSPKMRRYSNLGKAMKVVTDNGYTLDKITENEE